MTIVRRGGSAQSRNNAGGITRKHRQPQSTELKKRPGGGGQGAHKSWLRKAQFSTGRQRKEFGKDSREGVNSEKLLPDGLSEWLSKFARGAKWYDVAAHLFHQTPHSEKSSTGDVYVSGVGGGDKTALNLEWIIPEKISKLLKGGLFADEVDTIEAAAIFIDQEGSKISTALGKYFGNIEAPQNSELNFLREASRTGTLADKQSALALLVNELPFATCQELNRLLSMTTTSNLNASLMSLEAIKDLFINDLLPPNRKLFFVKENPNLQKFLFSKSKSKKGKTDRTSKSLSSGPWLLKIEPHQLLCLWYESYVKQTFAAAIKAIGELSTSYNEFTRRKAVTLCSELLINRTEQQEALFACLIYKLGDQQNKVAGAARDALLKVAFVNPGCKMHLIDSLWRAVYQNSTANRITVISNTLFVIRQIPVRKSGDREVACKLASTFLDFFAKCFDEEEPQKPNFKNFKIRNGRAAAAKSSPEDKSSEAKMRHRRTSVSSKFMLRFLHPSKIFLKKKKRFNKYSKKKKEVVESSVNGFNLSGCGYREDGHKIAKLCLSGLRRTLPFLPESEFQNMEIESKFDCLFRVCGASPNASVRIYAVSVLEKISSFLNGSIKDKFYRSVYDSLRYLNIYASSCVIEFIKVIRRIIIDDTNIYRRTALLRRFLQVITHWHYPSLSIESLEIVNTAFKNMPSMTDILRYSDKVLKEADTEELPQDTDDENDVKVIPPLVTEGGRGGTGDKSELQLNSIYDPSGISPLESNSLNSHLWEMDLWRSSIHPTIATLSLLSPKSLWRDITGVVPISDLNTKKNGKNESRSIETSFTRFSYSAFLDRFSYKMPKGHGNDGAELSRTSFAVNDPRKWADVAQRMKKRKDKTERVAKFVGDSEHKPAHNYGAHCSVRGIFEYPLTPPDEWFIGEYFLDEYVVNRNKVPGPKTGEEGDEEGDAWGDDMKHLLPTEIGDKDVKGYWESDSVEGEEDEGLWKFDGEGEEDEEPLSDWENQFPDIEDVPFHRSPFVPMPL